MASIVTQANGLRRIEFVVSPTDRRRIRLGRMEMSLARVVLRRVESLVSHMFTREPFDADLAKWVGDLSDAFHERLARAGLVPPRISTAAPEVVTLAKLLDAFFDAIDVKDSTRTTLLQTRTSLESYFKPAKPIHEIGPLEAELWAKSLRDSELAPATTAKRIKVAKAVFARAVLWNRIKTSPFATVKTGGMKNRERIRFVARDTIAKVLAQSKDPEFRLLIALARYGGLRVPSEALLLTWEHINWAAGRMSITSPKTEGAGKASRVVPIFPELAPFLQAAFDAAPEGSIYVIGRTRDAAANFRTQLERLIKRAAVPAWPRLWQNLRASRACELAADFPQHVAAEWLGHGVAVAQAHYWAAREEDFARALLTPAEAKAAQNAAQSPNGKTEQEATAETSVGAKQPVLKEKSPSRNSAREGRMTPRGFEPLFSG
ncbi:MAG: site-specific integrase [Phycisphaeraceae bacterium]|nr:site-specific integrase [Phycisphaeraceae bacterium]